MYGKREWNEIERKKITLILFGIIILANLLSEYTNDVNIEGFSLGGVFNQAKGAFSNAGNAFKSISNVGKSITGFFEKVFNFFKYIGAVFVWLGSAFVFVGKAIICAFKKIGTLNKCMFWYLLDMVGQILYLPFRFIFWMLGIKECDIWSPIYEVDDYFHQLTGQHFCRFPDWVNDMCYNCGIGEFPAPPKPHSF
jgi:hypothetical protein